MLKLPKIKPNDRRWLEHRIGKRSIIEEQRVKAIFRMAPEVVTRKQYGPKVDICESFTFVNRTMTTSSFLFREFGYYGHWNDRRYDTFRLLDRFDVSWPLGEPPYLNESPLRVSIDEWLALPSFFLSSRLCIWLLRMANRRSLLAKSYRHSSKISSINVWKSTLTNVPMPLNCFKCVPSPFLNVLSVSPF